MKHLLRIAAVLPLLVFGAAAQDEAGLAKLKDLAQIQLKVMGAVSGMTVKGAPYSGEEVNETNQVLADGTRIHRETRATVYRDSEGRTRRETPESIIITDPVAGVTYMLYPKSMTGSKMTMSRTATYSFRTDTAEALRSTASAGTVSATGSTFTMHMSSDSGTPTITVNGQTLDPAAVQELIAKAKASGDRTISINGAPFDPSALADAKLHAEKKVREVMIERTAKGEPLGKQTIEGVEAEGTRNVSTIEAGAIGNDRPIQVTGERWYSPELQTMVMTKHSDPRTGDESFRLINIRRGEPGSYLFQPPSGYTITDHK